MIQEAPAPRPLLEERTTCRACGQAGIERVLSLGSTALANRLLTREQLGEPEPIFPLTLGFCRRCSLAQLIETVAPELLFREYLYFSSFSDTMLHHAQALADRLVHERGLGSKHLVVELASNDGYLLQYFRQAGVGVLGIDPATNIAQVAQARGIPTLAEFFDQPLAERLRADGRVADVIIGINVLGHVANLNAFVEGIRILLAEDGAVIIEVPYVKDMIDRVEFDTIYHEHLPGSAVQPPRPPDHRGPAARYPRRFAAHHRRPRWDPAGPHRGGPGAGGGSRLGSERCRLLPRLRPAGAELAPVVARAPG
jgi:SAM-dependent methyltransferase